MVILASKDIESIAKCAATSLASRYFSGRDFFRFLACGKVIAHDAFIELSILAQFQTSDCKYFFVVEVDQARSSSVCINFSLSERLTLKSAVRFSEHLL